MLNKISDHFAKLLVCFNGGTIQIGMANRLVLEIRAEDSQIVLNLFTPKSIVHNDGKNNNNEDAAKLSLRRKISEAKDFAKYLTNNDLTIPMCYEDKEILVLGKKAKPKLSKLIIGSNDIQIKNLRQLRRLDNEFFNA